VSRVVIAMWSDAGEVTRRVGDPSSKPTVAASPVPEFSIATRLEEPDVRIWRAKAR
jgi:hypothetical protein